jgi:hypothetical protein
MLRTITTAEKDDCGQLMMADFAAHGEYVLETKAIEGALTRDRTPTAIPKGMTGHTHLQSTPEQLKIWRQEIIERATPKKGPNAPTSSHPASEQSS